MDIYYLVKKEALRRGLSRRTIKTYIYCINVFLRKCPKEISKISKKDVREYLDNFIDKGKCGNTINVHLNALKFLFEEILNKNMRLNIKYSKIPKTLPIVLTKKEVRDLIVAIDNEKHKLMIKLMYSAGLRVNELVHLKVKDLDFESSYGWVRKGKGNKDRLFIIANILKEELKECTKDLEYSDWIFKGNNGHITTRSIQQIIKKATKKAKIKKKVHTHTLRHSFATHLIENGYDVASVQSLLGHNSSETTMIYIHMASPRLINIKSPLDELEKSL